MDAEGFDAVLRALALDVSRRGGLAVLTGGLLAALPFARGGGDAAAKNKKKRKKKKKKKVQQCAGGTKLCGAQCIPQDNCCSDADCSDEATCVSGVCVAKIVDAGCRSDADCRLGDSCQNGTCLPDPAPACQDAGDCGIGEACLAGTCVLIQGTCAAADDHCSVVEALCNPDANTDCFCLQRIGGGVACTQAFVPGAVCGGCVNDAACDAIEPGSVCVSAVANGCPCAPGQGICAQLCDNQ